MKESVICNVLTPMGDKLNSAKMTANPTQTMICSICGWEYLDGCKHKIGRTYEVERQESVRVTPRAMRVRYEDGQPVMTY